MTTEPGGGTTGDSDKDIFTTLRIMALGCIYAWLAEDYWTITRIELALEATGATPRQVAESFSVAAASMLSDVCGGDSHTAEVLAATTAFGDVGRLARHQLAGHPGSGS
jgi:hypothetical protein